VSIEPPDLSEELRRIAAARIARLRHQRQVRAALQAARTVGVDRRNARKLERNRKEREQEATRRGDDS
jgi:hypothetical protein